MLEKIEILKKEIEEVSVQSLEELENFRIKYLSKRGVVSILFDEFRNVPSELKKEVGMKLNLLKQSAQEKLNEIKHTLESTDDRVSANDLTRPAYPYSIGSRHPISIVRNEIIDIFSRIGFIVSEGPEIEDDDHVYKAQFCPRTPRKRYAGYVLFIQDFKRGFKP